MRSDHLAKHIKTHQKKGSGGAVVASVDTSASSDIITTSGATTLILTNIQPGAVQGLATVNATVNTSNSQELLTTAEIPLQLVTVAASEAAEWRIHIEAEQQRGLSQLSGKKQLHKDSRKLFFYQTAKVTLLWA